MNITAKLNALLNSTRSNTNGGPPLARYPGMDAVAQDWAEEMARRDVLVHRPSVAPYRGEIIASGADTATTAMTLWLNSPPHRAIILDSRYTMAGIGYNAGYWCVVFN